MLSQKTCRTRYLAFSVLVLISVTIFSCAQNSAEKYNADQKLTVQEQQELTWSVIRYMGKLAPKATHETKFDSEFDEEYLKLAAIHSVDLIHQDKNTGEKFVLFSRIAPSIYERRVAVAVRLQHDENGEISRYEEVFRTWKMSPMEMQDKASKLFALLIDGKDLSPYYPENSGTDEYIEFPNAHVSFNVEQRRWISELEIPFHQSYQSALHQN